MLNRKKLYIIITATLVIFLANFLIFSCAPTQAVESAGGDANQELEAKKNQIKALQEKIDEYNKSISYYKSQSLSLTNQINILNREINKLEAEIELKEDQIDATNMEIKQTEEKITNTEGNIAKQKEYLISFLQKMNRLDQQTTVDLVLSFDSFSDYYNHLHALEILQNNTSAALGELKDFKKNLETNKIELDDKKKTLEKFKTELNDKKGNLSSRSYAKQGLLSESRNSESKFSSMVSQLKSEQAQINADIVALEKKLRLRLGNKIDLISDAGFMWPVPNNGLTAYFHDPDYPFRYIFEHPAVDIKSPQSSSIKASNSGYVAKVVLKGTAYGYIMLVHANGLSTVYGHVSRVYVSEDQYVSQGEEIGLTGGMPGTTGSGRLSTGPHLHFEIRKNGIPVNPLDYLP